MTQMNGHQILEWIRSLELRRDVLQREFENSLKAFAGEQKRDPRTIGEELHAAERDIARAQTVQTRYNLAVLVDVQGQRVPLTFVVKAIGAAGRLAALWRNVIGTKKDRYSSSFDQDNVRREGETHATATISTQAAAEQADTSAKYAGALRAAAATGNTVRAEIGDEGEVRLL